MRSARTYRSRRSRTSSSCRSSAARSLLRIEERTERENYYTLLEKAGIPTPRRFPGPEAIDRLAIVKLPHATRRLERGFFTAASPKEFREKSKRLLALGTIAKGDLRTARIEEYVLGPVFNFNFFFSPLVPRTEGLELLGVDERRRAISTVSFASRRPSSSSSPSRHGSPSTPSSATGR